MKIRSLSTLAVIILLSPLQAVLGDTHPTRGTNDKIPSSNQSSHGSEHRQNLEKNKENQKGGIPRVALMFVGHGEPSRVEDGDNPITFPDDSPFGPHAVELGVPEEFQHTEWAAAYEEIATAMAYIFGDLNQNGIAHEVAMMPEGDVPGFFSWDAYHTDIYTIYDQCGGYSPHNDLIREHVENLQIKVNGAKINIYLALLDDVPRIPDVVYEIAQGRYDELVVVPMLVANSTHTEEITGQLEEMEHVLGDIEVTFAEPFFEIPYMRDSLGDAIVNMAHHLRATLPPEVEDHNIGILLASHGTPYAPPFPEFGWKEGDIYSELIPTEDAFHEGIGTKLPWASKTGRMNYSSPTIEDALKDFEQEGFTHVIVVPSAFPTVAIHTMYHVPEAAVGRIVTPEDGIVEHQRDSGMKVFCTGIGVADLEKGRNEFRTGLEFIGKISVMEALEKTPDELISEAELYPPDTLCVTLDSTVVLSNALNFMLYDLDGMEWPDDFDALPMPDWVLSLPVEIPEQMPARLRIPMIGNLISLSGKTMNENQVGLAISSSPADQAVGPGDPRGFSTLTPMHSTEVGLDFGRVDVKPPNIKPPCLPGEVCVTVTADQVTGPDLKLMLYATSDEDWPGSYQTLPTPSAVVTETVPVPDEFPIHIRIPLEGNLFTFSGDEVVGQRLGLVVVTGVAANFVVEATDARGFSAGTLIYDPEQPLDYGDIDLFIPQGNPSDINPYHPERLTGGLFWEEHMLGTNGFVPGAIYMDMHDLDADGVKDIIMVGEPHFEEPDLPLTVLRLGVMYMNADKTVKGTEIIDQWSEADPLFYSPWGVNVIEHSGLPMIVVGCNIPELAPLEEGSGAILSYHKIGENWVRTEMRSNPNPTNENYNAMIVVSADIDHDGDDDIAISGAFGTSAVGSWMENTGTINAPWISHLLPAHPGTDPAIRGTLAYKAADLNNDGYPEIVYNAMFDIPGTVPPRYRGEIWMAINPGPGNWDQLWEKVVIDDDNWAAADMWFHDFDSDGFKDLIANQIFDSTVTRYWNPSGNLTDSWIPEIIISGLASPSDMYLADMDDDGLMDVVSADHTAHRGFWHQNPGTGVSERWKPNLIYRNIRLPGDFAIIDLDEDGDKDWVGTSMTLGKAFIVEQIQPPTSLITSISLPEGFSGTATKLMVTLASALPVTGPPDAVLAEISNADSDGDGIGDVDKILNSDLDLTLAFSDVGVTGEYHVVVALYLEGGGVFQPVPGVDYMASSAKRTLGQGQEKVSLNLTIIPSMAPLATTFDSYGAGQMDLAENIAGTNASDLSDQFRILEVTTGVGDGSTSLTWNSKPGKRYGIFACTNLMSGWILVETITGDGSVMTYVGENEAHQQFYQLRILE